MKKTRQTSIVAALCLSLLLSLFPGGSLAAKKEAKIKKVEVRTTDSGVLVMKKKERRPEELGSQWLNAMCDILIGGALAEVLTDKLERL